MSKRFLGFFRPRRSRQKTSPANPISETQALLIKVTTDAFRDRLIKDALAKPSEFLSPPQPIHPVRWYKRLYYRFMWKFVWKEDDYD